MTLFRLLTPAPAPRDAEPPRQPRGDTQPGRFRQPEPPPAFRLTLLHTDSPVGPQDVAATIRHTPGVPLHTRYEAQDGRPIELCAEGKPVRALVG